MTESTRYFIICENYPDNCKDDESNIGPGVAEYAAPFDPHNRTCGFCGGAMREAEQHEVEAYLRHDSNS